MTCATVLLRHVFFSSRRRHTMSLCDWISDVCSSVLVAVLHVSLALDAAVTLASVGKLAGLQPRARPLVGTVRLGPVESLVQENGTSHTWTLVTQSTRMTASSWQNTQPAIVSRWVALI